MILEPTEKIRILGRSDRDGHFAELWDDDERMAVAMGATVEEALENLRREMARQGIRR